jgi:DNA transposition AAA+ family ATPase
MKKEFVKTENHTRFMTALAQKAAHAAAESNLVVVRGRAGDGKTCTMHNYAAGTTAVMLTANPSWTPRRAMAEIAAKLSIPISGAWEASVEGAIADGEVPLIVDEAGFALADNAACVERLRSITDKSGTLLVLVVMERDMDRLLKFDQITSRSTLCAFGASTLADVRAACTQLAEVQIADDLVDRIHRDTGGRMRLVVEAINLVEALTGHNPDPAKRRSVCAADVKGIALCDDFARSLQRAARGARRGGA